MVKEIELSQGMVALVNDADYAELAQHRWCANRIGGNFYAVRNGPRTDGHRARIYLHRIILGAPPDMGVDHINGDGLDNRRNNLRLATKSQNGANRTHKQRGTTSRFLGVRWHKRSGKWHAEIQVNGKQKTLACFDSEIDAALAYNEAALELHGEFASINDLDNPGEIISAAENA